MQPNHKVKIKGVIKIAEIKHHHKTLSNFDFYIYS